MSILMNLPAYIYRNSLRATPKNIPLAPATVRMHSKVEGTPSAVGDEQVTKTITRKKYNELPTVRKLCDGSNASALDEWLGGLNQHRSSLERPSDIDPAASASEMREAVYQEPPRKRRKTKATNSRDLPLEGAAALKGGTLQAGNLKGRSRRSGAIVQDAELQGKTKRKPKKPAEVRTTMAGRGATSVIETIPVKVKRKMKRVKKGNNVSSEIESPERKLEMSLPVTRKRITRPRRVLSALLTDEPADKARRMPQNQLATEILENLSKFPHCILLTRVGSFYESYFDQAAEVARLLSIKLTKRTWDRQEILMCGFPIVHLDRHLKVLLQTHKRSVAMCEEFRRTNPEEGFERRVVRVLTPGTLIDESFLNPYENNYLLAVGSVQSNVTSGLVIKDELTDIDAPETVASITPQQAPLGLAWIDVSTGEFFTQCTTLGGLRNDLARVGPREVVLHSSLEELPSHAVRSAVAEEGSFISYISPRPSSSSPETIDLTSPISHADDLIAEPVPPSKSPAGAVFTDHETSAISLLISFLQANLLEHMPVLSSPARQWEQDRMQIDSHTIKALEIKEGMREGGATGSLLSVVKRTVTSSGTRLLARWLCSPSTSLKEIQARQSLVALFRFRHHLRDDLVLLLKRIEDTSRIVQRFLLGRGTVEDLSAIKSAIEIWGEIKSRIDMESTMEEQGPPKEDGDEWQYLKGLLLRMADLRGLSLHIGMAVNVQQNIPPAAEHPELDFPTEVHDMIQANMPTAKGGGQQKWVIKPDFSSELSSLHAHLAEAEASRQRLEQELQRRYDAPSLTLRSSGNYGVHVHIGKSKRDLGKIERSPHFTPIGSTGSTKSFFNQTWYLLGTKITETITQILAAERNAFESLRRQVNSEASALRRNARIVDELDVTLGFASLASEMQFVQPVLNERTSYLVTNGRHPSVELGLLTSGRVFTPNTVSLTPDSRLHIITGPNMAGKSTLLRQTALLAVLAQTGSFVPANKAEMGIVDKVFSRVGAKDDLFRDRSTFMVEMLETAEILNCATERSLVIMDEVGRGTTVKDGLAIAFATVCHLYNVNRCRALFATHFHEVVDMLGYVEGSMPQGFFKNIGFFCTDVEETEDGHFAYSHRLRPGVNRDSHGLKVARLGGMPPSAMKIAHDALDWMKGRQGSWIADEEQLRAAGEALVNRRDHLTESRRVSTIPS